MTGGAAWGYDPVKELQDILAGHPHVTYLRPRESATGMHTAVWQQPSADPSRDGAVREVRHEEIRDFVAALRAELGPGRPS